LFGNLPGVRAKPPVASMLSDALIRRYPDKPATARVATGGGRCVIEALDRYGLKDVLGVAGLQAQARDDPPQQGFLRQENVGELDVRWPAARRPCWVCVFRRHNPHLPSRALSVFTYHNAPGAAPVEEKSRGIAPETEGLPAPWRHPERRPG
jgi:hypothetical protein